MNLNINQSKNEFKKKTSHRNLQKKFEKLKVINTNSKKLNFQVLIK